MAGGSHAHGDQVTASLGKAEGFIKRGDLIDTRQGYVKPLTQVDQVLFLKPFIFFLDVEENLYECCRRSVVAIDYCIKVELGRLRFNGHGFLHDFERYKNNSFGGLSK